MQTADNNDQMTATSTSVQDTWGEEELQRALSNLKEMYIQLRKLRTCIPRLVHPLHTDAQQSAPETLYNKFETATALVSEEVKQFRQLLEDDYSREIFEHAKASKATEPKGITPWKITENPDWLVR